MKYLSGKYRIRFESGKEIIMYLKSQQYKTLYEIGVQLGISSVTYLQIIK